MKYSFSAAGFKVWERYMQIYLKLHSITGIFQRISSQVQKSDIEKCILMAASENKFILETFLHGCFVTAATNIFILEILIDTFHFLLWCQVKEEQMFMIFFK